jgi:hypothetical protein
VCVCVCGSITRPLKEGFVAGSLLLHGLMAFFVVFFFVFVFVAGSFSAPLSPRRTGQAFAYTRLTSASRVAVPRQLDSCLALQPALRVPQHFFLIGLRHRDGAPLLNAMIIFFSGVCRLFLYITYLCTPLLSCALFFLFCLCNTSENKNPVPPLSASALLLFIRIKKRKDERKKKNRMGALIAIFFSMCVSMCVRVCVCRLPVTQHHCISLFFHFFLAAPAGLRQGPHLSAVKQKRKRDFFSFFVCRGSALRSGAMHARPQEPNSSDTLLMSNTDSNDDNCSCVYPAT